MTPSQQTAPPLEISIAAQHRFGGSIHSPPHVRRWIRFLIGWAFLATPRVRSRSHFPGFHGAHAAVGASQFWVAPSHPPFLAYLPKLWFSIFPLADWTMTPLAVITVSAGIYLS
jgi:hypothetical protein